MKRRTAPAERERLRVKLTIRTSERRLWGLRVAKVHQERSIQALVNDGIEQVIAKDAALRRAKRDGNNLVNDGIEQVIAKDAALRRAKRDGKAGV